MPSDGRSSRLGAIGLQLGIAIAAFAAGMSVRGALAPAFAALALLPLMVAVVIGVAFPASGVFARVQLRGVSGRRQIALTFDDGPHPHWTPALLDLLDSRNQRATFFVVGDRAAGQAALLQDMVRRGHEIANHTWSHSYLTPFMSPRVLAAELVRTNELVYGATGITPIWFRPPVGLLSPRVAEAAERAGLDLVCWSATARDGVIRTTVQQAVQRLLVALKPGAILALHDARLSGDAEPAALRVVSLLLDRMEAAELHSVTLSELCAPQLRAQ